MPVFGKFLLFVQYQRCLALVIEEFVVFFIVQLEFVSLPDHARENEKEQRSERERKTKGRESNDGARPDRQDNLMDIMWCETKTHTENNGL